MTDNKKLGIRLRHLQQKDEERKRDLSPGAANRKKIFEKLPFQKVGERQNLEDKLRSPKGIQPQTDSSQVDKLIQNLKRKSMEVELRDNMIKSLNREIDELKRDLKNKEREILKLNNQIQRLEKVSKISKTNDKETNVFQSFRDPIPLSNFGKEDRKIDINLPNDKVGNALSGEITMNLQSRPAQRRNIEEPEILSPFMALANKSNQLILHSQDTFSRDHSQTFSGFSNLKGNEVGNTAKSNIINPFDRSSQSPFSQSASAFSKKPVEYQQKKSSNIDKFNIFNQQSGRSDVKANNSKLAIEDSRQFKFEEFDQSDFH